MDGYWCDACRGPWEPGQGLFCHCPCAKPAYIDADVRFRWKYPRQELTVDDLVRLVVGMQWQMAIAQAIVVEIRNADGSWTASTRPDGGLTRLHWNECGVPDIGVRPAVDIVDEWLGVRP